MKSSSLKILLGLFSSSLFCVPLAVAADGPTTTSTVATYQDATIQREVLEANSRMLAAINRMDVDGFFAFIVDSDAGMIAQNGAIFRTRQEAYETVKRGMVGVAKIERKFENPQVAVVSPDVACLVSNGTVAATLSDGREINGRFAVTLLFVRRDGAWKVLHGHYSTLPAGT